jgi:crossover junction endodeoxyribonuclease RuvC
MLYRHAHGQRGAPDGGHVIITGLDLSLTSTGVARITDGDVLLHRIQPRKMTGHDRLDYLLKEVADWAGDADVVAIEGPSYGSTGGSQHERAGLWWLVAHNLWQSLVPYASVPPSNLKKYATGFGGGAKSGKDQVLAAVIRRYPDVPVDGNDVCDAFVLAAMAADHYGHPVGEAPKTHRAGLQAIAWPHVEVPTVRL